MFSGWFLLFLHLISGEGPSFCFCLKELKFLDIMILLSLPLDSFGTSIFLCFFFQYWRLNLVQWKSSSSTNPYISLLIIFCSYILQKLHLIYYIFKILINITYYLLCILFCLCISCMPGGQGGQQELSGALGYESSDIVAGNWTQVLCKINRYS